MIEPTPPPVDARCPNCSHLLGDGEPVTPRDMAGVMVRRRMLKAGAVLALVLLVGWIFLFAAPQLSKVELTVIAALAALLFGPRLLRSCNRARDFWPFRRR